MRKGVSKRGSMEKTNSENEAWGRLTGSWELCENYTTVPWKMRTECVHHMEYLWCKGCPRVNGAKEVGTLREVKDVSKSGR